MIQYIARRLAFMVVSLFAISFVAFVIIELPPGDYLTLYINQLTIRGERVDEARIESLKAEYGYGQPFMVRYYKWVSGIVVRGDFGRSLQWREPVSDLIMRRLPVTVLISTMTIIFTYLVAIPIGIYSATHQYSISDYVVMMFGFIGLAVPSFLLAMFLMYFLYTQLGVPPGGLFSDQYRDAAWSLGKVVDLGKHLIVPIIVTGMAGTAGGIRGLRATLLDELWMDYVETARVKGLSETRLVLKYPVRVALNPMFSTVGHVLPAIVSGATIVDVVLNLPTVGPLLLGSLKSQDMYLAGSLVFILTFLTLVGVFISDIVLVISDPRIRYE
ncbi:MAG: transporter permease subunit [Chloroflexota bacterium]|nr:transporter permease subunit [Chloroflexota bacterium]